MASINRRPHTPWTSGQFSNEPPLTTPGIGPTVAWEDGPWYLRTRGGLLSAKLMPIGHGLSIAPSNAPPPWVPTFRGPLKKARWHVCLFGPPMVGNS